MQIIILGNFLILQVQLNNWLQHQTNRVNLTIYCTPNNLGAIQPHLARGPDARKNHEKLRTAAPKGIGTAGWGELSAVSCRSQHQHRAKSRRLFLKALLMHNGWASLIILALGDMLVLREDNLGQYRTTHPGRVPC